MTKQQAQRRGKKLLKSVRLKYKRLDVWENLGWHYAVRVVADNKVNITVHSGHHGESIFHCMLSTMASCGNSDWTDHKTFKDPNKAIAHTLKLARAVSDQLSAFVTTAESLVIKSAPR